VDPSGQSDGSLYSVDAGGRRPGTGADSIHDAHRRGGPHQQIGDGDRFEETNPEAIAGFIDANRHGRQTGRGEPVDEPINARERRRGPARLPGDSFREQANRARTDGGFAQQAAEGTRGALWIRSSERNRIAAHGGGHPR
jgi:hypothetical protein